MIASVQKNKSKHTRGKKTKNLNAFFSMDKTKQCANCFVLSILKNFNFLPFVCFELFLNCVRIDRYYIYYRYKLFAL